MSGKFAVLGEIVDKPKPAAKPQQQQQQQKKKADAAPSAAPAAGGDAPAPRVGGAAASTRARGPRGAEKNRGTRPPRREFDRQSGTGRGREVRKNGEGRGGWGNERNPNPRNKDVEAKNVEGGDKPETAAVEGEAKAEGEVATVVPEPEKKVPEEPPIFTLQDYEKQKQAAAVADDYKPPREVVAPVDSKAKTINKGATVSAKPAAAVAAPKAKKEKKSFSLDEFVSSTPAAAVPTQSSGPRRGSRIPADAFPKLK